MNVAESVERTARHFPDAPALLFEGSAISYRSLRDQVARLAAGLHAAGIQPGDRVVLFLPNSPAFVLAYLACQWVGAISVSANVMLTSEELRYVLLDSGARLAVTTEAHWGVVEPLADGVLGGREHVVVAEGAVAGTRSLGDLGQGLPTTSPMYREATDPAAILYTSGTTGRQKGATLSVGNVVFNAHVTRHTLRIDPDDRLLLFLPLFHVFGQNFILNAALAAGAAVVLHRRFDLDAVVASIEHDRVSMFFAVPTVYVGMLGAGAPLASLANVRYFFSAAATMPLDVAQRWREAYGRTIHEGYGLTETSPFASYNHEWAYRPGSVGSALPNVELRIVDEADQEVARGVWGEICIKGPNVMLGYWNRPEESAEALRGGWFHSGDVGYMDEDEYVFIVDRTKDMINTAGFKIWPREVEEVLYEHAAIAECAVVAAPDSVKGEVAVAVIVFKREQTATPEALDAYCRERLAAYKVPRSFLLVDALPKSATGKILKRVIRDQLATRYAGQ